MKCIIIGGGVIGMLTAYRLAPEGVEVTVIDRGRLGGESSWAGGGILSPLPPWEGPPACRPLCAWSQSQWPELADRLRSESGIDPEYMPSGLLIVDPAGGPGAEAWCRETGTRVEARAPVTAAGLNLGDRPAWWFPEVAQIRNPRLLQALAEACAARGVRFREHEPVEAVLSEAGRAQGVRVAGRFEPADVVVVAAGAWSGEFLPGWREAIQPVRGQMLLFRAPPALLGTIVLDAGIYLIPRRDGRILAGSTVEHAGFDKSITPEARETLRAAACRLLPALADYPVERQWAGLRPATGTGIPIIGEHPEIRGLFVHGGHFRNGFTMGPASARLLADFVLGRPLWTDPAPFRLPALS